MYFDSQGGTTNDKDPDTNTSAPASLHTGEDRDEFSQPDKAASDRA